MVSFGVEDFVKRYGALKPSQFVDVVALSGDKADNIPGSLLLLLFPMMHASSSMISFFLFFFKFLTSTDKERIKCMEHTLCCLVCLLHDPELLSFQIIIDEKHGDLILFCTKLGTKHTSDYCRIDTALCLIIFIFLVYYVSTSLTYFRSPIVKMVIFKK